MTAVTAVTGATGHIGANLVRALLAEGRDVRAVTAEALEHTPPALAGLDVERVHADIRDPASLERAFRGAEAVYHLAGRISIVGDCSNALDDARCEHSQRDHRLKAELQHRFDSNR